MRTPSRSWPLWLVGLVLWFGFPALVLYDGHIYYAEGGTSPDAPGMTFAVVSGFSVFAAPVWLLLLWGYLRRYPGAVSLGVWRPGGLADALLSLVATIVSFYFLWIALFRVDFWKFDRLPFLLYWLALASYFQFLRASTVGGSMIGD